VIDVEARVESRGTDEELRAEIVQAIATALTTRKADRRDDRDHQEASLSSILMRRNRLWGR
jgi:hypothetical protein